MKREPKLWLSRSWTTRARRDEETDDAYTFVDRETFLARAKGGGFLEWATVLGEYYGTPTPEPPAGYDVVLEIDVQGAEQVIERRDGVVCVLLAPPSLEAQAERLRARGDTEEHVKKRLHLGELEMEIGRRIADYVVVNDDLDRAVGELAAIVQEARSKEPPVSES